MKEEYRIVFHRLFWFILLVISIIVFVSYYGDKNIHNSQNFIILEIDAICLVFSFVFFGASLFLSYKEYNYFGKQLSVYAGWFHHTLRVNGEVCDEHNTITSWTPIKLSTTLYDGTKIDATITLTNRISLKANDKLLPNY